MRWVTKQKGVWHPWFAWYPALLHPYNTLGGNEYAWLTTVQRKLTQQQGSILREYRTDA